MKIIERVADSIIPVVKGVPHARIDEDITILGNTLDETRANGLKSLAYLYTPFGGYDHALEEFKSKHKIDSYEEINLDILKDYAVMDALVTRLVFVNMYRHMQELDQKYPNVLYPQHTLEEYYHTKRIPACNLYERAEFKGMYINKGKLDILRKQMQAKLDEIKGQLAKMFGVSKDFEFDSNDKLGKLLQQKGWKQMTSTEKGGFSTDDKAMQLWSKNHEEAKLIQTMRTITVLKNTFVGDVQGTKGWTQYMVYHPEDNSWRIHCNFHPMGTDSGRTRCSEPNLQNIPTRGMFASDVKSCICTPDDDNYLLMTVDYSSLQIRLCAIDSEDETLCTTFKKNKRVDMHSITAFNTFVTGKKFKVTEVDVEQDGKKKHFLGGQVVLTTNRGEIFASDLEDTDTLAASEFE